MDARAMLDLDAIARACKRYGVERLRVFGSALTDRFDPDGSDIGRFPVIVANPELKGSRCHGEGTTRHQLRRSVATSI